MNRVQDSQTTLCRSEDDEEEELESQPDHKKRLKEFAKKSAKYVGSQVGLIIMVSLYAVAGGFIFQHLESTNEMSECVQGETQFNEMQNSTIYKMWSIASSFQSADDKQVII